jgi:NitT/TauT family transport system permease protein
VTQSRIVRRYAMPYIVFFQVLPKVVLAPVFIAWLGFGLGPKIMLAAAISFFAVLSNAIKGIEQVPENSLRLMRSLTASRRQTVRMLVLPSTLPYLFAGLRSGVTLALIGAVVAEFVTARQGLGRLVTTFSANFQREEMWAATVSIGIVGLLLYGSIALLGYFLVRWRP